MTELVLRDLADGSCRERCTVRRVRTNTPLQALTALNDAAFFEAAKALAARVLRSTSDPGSRATLTFRLVTSRVPTPAELQMILGSYAKQLEKYRADSPAAERVIKGFAVAGVNAPEQAAWTLVANALLNLDEALTKE